MVIIIDARLTTEHGRVFSHTVLDSVIAVCPTLYQSFSYSVVDDTIRTNKSAHTFTHVKKIPVENFVRLV